MNASSRQLYEMRLGLSMQFQQGALFESISALENVQWPLVMHATVSAKEAEDRAAQDVITSYSIHYTKLYDQSAPSGFQNRGMV